MAFTITRAPFSKVRGSAALEESAEQPDVLLEAIVKVLEPGYVPPTVKLRTRIDDLMLTAETEAGSLPELDKDPKVVSVSVSRPMRLIR
ncbi:hypothetical protein [Methylobacterium sp. ID0610]|uniref:hypothetical protein n=1 Tax=Methylobacterium carpenticola TaxID=3344827 RepID=UPI00369B40DE